MTLTSFQRLAPPDLTQAVKLYDELYNRARLYAGGTDILVQIRQGRLTPEYLIDIKGLEEFKTVAYSPETGLTIGALTTFHKLETSALVKNRYPVLLDAVSRIGSLQIRNRATIGGNICNAVPSADSVPPLMVLGANLVIQGVAGRRVTPLETFFLGPGKTTLARGEILIRIEAPPVSPSTGAAYYKFMRRKAMALALLGVAVYLECKPGTNICMRARIALATAAPTSIRVAAAENFLVNKELNLETLKQAGVIASREARPRDSFRSTAYFRREMIKTILPRIAGTALQRITQAEANS